MYVHQIIWNVKTFGIKSTLFNVLGTNVLGVGKHNDDVEDWSQSEFVRIFVCIRIISISYDIGIKRLAS